MKTNTNLCVDLKTHMKDDVLLEPGKNYNGVLRHDPVEEFGEDHYTFTETCNSSNKKCYPHIFEGRFIHVSMHADGTLMGPGEDSGNIIRIDKDFTVNRYAAGVAKELRIAFSGLIDGSK